MNAIEGIVDRDEFLPFCKPDLGARELAAVHDVLQSGWLTYGPRVREFGAACGQFLGAEHAVPVARQSGTAAANDHCQSSTATPSMAAENAITDPTDRSISPTIRTNVMPTAITMALGISLASVGNVLVEYL